MPPDISDGQSCDFDELEGKLVPGWLYHKGQQVGGGQTHKHRS